MINSTSNNIVCSSLKNKLKNLWAYCNCRLSQKAANFTGKYLCWSLFTIKFTAQKMKFSIKDFFSKCDQIGRKLRIWSHLLKKYLMENFVFLCSGYRTESPTFLKRDSNTGIFLVKFAKFLGAPILNICLSNAWKR